jgi:hypothetical protein
MTKTNLIEKRKRLQQRKSRIREIEASLNAQERKKRTRRLIELGGLVLKAQLDSWDSNTLLGALLSNKEKETDKKQMEAWTHKGGIAFASEKSPKTPVIVKFKDKPLEDTRLSLKAIGLKWNSLRSEWEGYVNIEELTKLLSSVEADLKVIENSA